jgi:hypothetical protein
MLNLDISEEFKNDLEQLASQQGITLAGLVEKR